MQPSQVEFRFRVLALVAVLGVLPTLAGAAGCPREVRFEPTASGGVLDAGWQGLGHGIPIFGTALDLYVSCAASTPPCGTCAITGVVPEPAGHRLRCENDTSIACTVATEVADCGAADTCRHFLSPPQSLAAGGVPYCALVEVAGGVEGSVDVESGDFESTLPLHVRISVGVVGGIFGNGGRNQGCPRCDGDVAPNDLVRDGICDAGPRAGLSCDAHGSSPLADFGSTSFDCPQWNPYFYGTIDFGRLVLSTGSESVTLSTASPPCTGAGFGGMPCFCDTCNNAAREPCAANSDCPPSGGSPGVCGGKRCTGGSNDGAPCKQTSECPGIASCSRPGEQTRPSACVDNTTTPETEACTPSGGGTGTCASGPITVYCTNHPNRACNEDADCDDVPGACTIAWRPCYSDNGMLGAAVTASGTATPPVAGVAFPTDLAALSCLGPTSSPVTNIVFGLPGLARLQQSGQLVFDDSLPPGPTPTPGLCPLAPAVCRTPTASHRATLQLTHRDADDQDQLVWKWTKGAATMLADFGNPFAVDDYVLCLYDASGWRATMRIPAGGTCQDKPCWRPKSKGFAYRSHDRVPHGITALTLRPGADGKAQVQAEGKGDLLPMPSLPSLMPPLEVQLRNATSGVCWSATYSAPFDTATDQRLKDKAD